MPFCLLDIPVFFGVVLFFARRMIRARCLVRQASADELVFLGIRHGIAGDHVAEHVDSRLRRGLFRVAPVDRRTGSDALVRHDTSLPFWLIWCDFGFILVLLVWVVNVCRYITDFFVRKHV